MASKEPEPEPAADDKDALDALEAEAKEFEKVKDSLHTYHSLEPVANGRVRMLRLIGF